MNMGLAVDRLAVDRLAVDSILFRCERLSIQLGPRLSRVEGYSTVHKQVGPTFSQQGNAGPMEAVRCVQVML